MSGSARPTPGSLVDFFADGQIVAGVVIAEEKGRYRVVTETGREDRIAPARVLAAYDGNPRLAPAGATKADASRVQAAHALASAHARAARERRGSLDLSVVWDLLVDEGGERTLGELTELVTGERTAASAAAVLRALLEEKVHFARRADLWEPRSRALVEEMLRQREREKRKAEERGRLLTAARSALTSGATFTRSHEEEESRLLAALEETAVMGSGGASGPVIREAGLLLGELGIRSETLEEGAFRVLRALGVFAEDENLLLRRFGLRPEFPEGAEEQAREAVARALDGASGGTPASGGPSGSRGAEPAAGLAAEIASGARSDLTHLETFTVDDPMTSEIDDALSIEERDAGSTRVGIHIADPGFFILPDTHLDWLAQSRAVTLYLPDHRALMLPSPIAEDAASLVPDAARPALSFFAKVDGSGALTAWEIVPSVIRSRARVAYEEADAAVRSAGPEGPEPPALPAPVVAQLRSLHALALLLEGARVAAGAHLIRAPEVDLSVGPDGAINVKRMESDDPGRVLVSEMMVLAGRIASLYCLERGVPCIYRRQPPAEEAFPSITGGPYDPVAVRKARRGLRRGEVGLTPGRHYALGLDAYTQATSPIRRYQDLVIHRQIKSTLRGEAPCYDAEKLGGLAALTDDAERVARLAERGSDEYWTLKLLEKSKGGTVEGVVVFRDRRRVEVELSETLYNVSVALRPDHELGQRLRFVVESVNPRAASIHLRQLD